MCEKKEKGRNICQEVLVIANDLLVRQGAEGGKSAKLTRASTNRRFRVIMKRKLRQTGEVIINDK